MGRAIHALGAIALGAVGGLVFYTQAALQSPGATVKKGVEALRSADFEALRKCYSAPAWAIVSDAVPSPRDTEAQQRLRRYMSAVRGVRILTATVRGATAEVEAVVEHEHGLDREVFLLTKARGTWYFALEPGDPGTPAPAVIRDPQEVEAYFGTDHARIKHNWLLRALVEGTQPDEAPDPAYTMLGGGLDELAPSALADRTAIDANEFAKAALIGMTRGLLERPDVVCAELARGLISEGARAYLANDRLYRAWRSGAPLTEQDRIDYVSRDGGLARLGMGIRLADESKLYAHNPGPWDQVRLDRIDEVDELERASGGYDALGVYLAVRPLIDEALSNVKTYAPYSNQGRDLDALFSGTWDRLHAVSADLQAALVIAPGANMRRTGVYQTEGVRRFNEVLWRYDAGERVGGQPAVRNDTLYYATAARYRWDSSFVHAVGIGSRETKWSFEAPARRPTSISLMGSRVYLSCGDEGSSPAYLCAIDALTGEPVWTFQGPRGAEGLLSHPVMDESGVYVADNWGALFALDGETGEEMWRFEGKATKCKSPPTPSLADGTIYLPGLNEIYAVDTATGQEKWRLGGRASEGIVAVNGRAMYYYNRGLSAVSLDDRRQLWRFEPNDRSGSLRGCPAVDGDAVYARDQQIVYALDAQTGELIWKLDVGRPIDWKVSPVVADGTIYIGSGAGTDDQSKSCLHAIDTGTGRELWRLPLDADLYGSAPIVSAGVIYFSAAADVYAVH
jgi:outer membrane protein assembly factor BamB